MRARKASRDGAAGWWKMMIDALIFALLLMFGLFYALLLEFSERCCRFVTQQTWLTVVIGVGATLGMIGLFTVFSELAYWKVCAAFVATGVPVIGRSLLHQVVDNVTQRQELIDDATPRE